MTSPAPTGIWLQPVQVSDLTTFASRARQPDPQGCIRLIAQGQSLASYVSFGQSGPLVLALRAWLLAQADTFDLTVTLSSLLDRLVRVTGADGDPVEVPLPLAAGVAAGARLAVSPPKAGWVLRDPADQVPPPAAAAIEAMGFADPQQQPAMFRCGPWERFSTSRGHVLFRAHGPLV